MVAVLVPHKMVPFFSVGKKIKRGEIMNSWSEAFVICKPGAGLRPRHSA